MLFSEKRLVWDTEAPNAPSDVPASPAAQLESQTPLPTTPETEAVKTEAEKAIGTGIRSSLMDPSLVPEGAEDLKTDIARDNIEETIGEKIETVSDLRELSVEKLFKLEAKHEGILFYAFTDFKEGNDKLQLDKWENFYKNPVDGAEFTINFYGNDEAYARMGADDILPPSVRKITVYKDGKTDPGNTRTSTRRIGLKGRGKAKDNSGFFDAKGYMPVYTGDVIVIGGIEPDFETKYRDRKGELDFRSYKKDKKVSDENEKFLDALPPDARRSKYYDGDDMSRQLKNQLGLKTKGGDLSKILKDQPDMYHYMHKYREVYAQKTKIDIPESIMFAIAKRESGFNVTSMNNQGSGAGGLFQFIPGTWADFLEANPEMKSKLAADPVWGKMNQLQWRFNPEAMIAAGYWYATANMQNLRKNKNSFTYSAFRNSDLYKKDNSEVATLTQDDAWIVYLCHHDGLGGAKKMLKYKGYKEDGLSEGAAADRVVLAGWQRYKILSYKPLTYDKSGEMADEHFNMVVSGDVVQMSKRYEGLLAGTTAPATGTNWGWEGVA